MASNNEEVLNPSAEPGGQSVPLDPKVLEDAFSRALEGFFPSFLSSNSVRTDARAQFFQLYERQAEGFDKEFTEKYDEDANTTLIFAGLFSTVAAAFLIDAQKNIQPDYAQMSAALLQIIVYKMNNSTFSSPDFPLPTWNGPTPTMVNVQCLLYISLAASLIAAFGAMLGKQWIRYSRFGDGRSVMEMSRNHQRKFIGLKRWHFDLVMESLPLLLQGALLLLGLALSLYLWTIFTTVGAVIIFFTSFGVALYVAFIVCGTLWYDCPFQTPASTFIRALFKYAKHSRYISAVYKGFHFSVEKFSSIITQAGSQFRRLGRADVEAAFAEVEYEGHAGMQNDAIRLFTEEKVTNWDSHIADADCICWMLRTTIDTDFEIATIRFIPDIEWHSGVVVVPKLDKLWNDFVSCDDPARPSDRMTAETRDKAFVTLKALVHLYAQRRCVDDIYTLDWDVLPYFRHHVLKSDVQILSTLRLLRGLTDNRFYSLDDFVPGVSIQHLAWMLHIILYRLKKDESVRNDIDIHKFIQAVLERDHSPSFLTDCFLAIGLTIGMPVHINDLMVTDKSARRDDVVRMLFKQISWRIEQGSVSPEHLYRTIHTLETLTYCQNPPESVSVACYDLCKGILGSTVEESMRWKASQLVMQIGFRHSPSLRLWANDRVGWPATGLNYLEHQFALECPEEFDYDTTADLFSALSNVDWDNDMDLTKPFFSGMIASLQVDKPARLKPQIIRFISRFSDHIYDAGVEAMSEEEKRIFLSAISSEVDTERGKYYCKNILKDAIRSDVWRRYLGLEHLNLLESLVSVIGFGAHGIRDTSLIPALADENLLNGAILKTWLQVIWLDLHIHIPDWEMTQQAQSAIKELFIRRPELMDDFRMAINLQTQNEYYKWHTNGVQRGRDKLEEICKDVSSTLHAKPLISL